MQTYLHLCSGMFQVPFWSNISCYLLIILPGLQESCALPAATGVALTEGLEEASILWLTPGTLEVKAHVSAGSAVDVPAVLPSWLAWEDDEPQWLRSTSSTSTCSWPRLTVLSPFFFLPQHFSLLCPTGFFITHFAAAKFWLTGYSWWCW